MKKIKAKGSGIFTSTLSSNLKDYVSISIIYKNKSSEQ